MTSFVESKRSENWQTVVKRMKLVRNSMLSKNIRKYLLKVLTLLIKNWIYIILQENNYIECQIQKGYIQRLTDALGHTCSLSYLIDQARI